MHLAPMDNSDPAIKAQFDAAVAFHNSGQGAQAQTGYESVIAACPSHAEAMHNLGLLFVQHGHFADAAEWMRRAVATDSSQPVYLSNYGNVLQDLQRWSEAVPQYEKATLLDPNYIDAIYNLGNALQKLARHEDAVENYHRVIALNPIWAEAHLNCGNSYDALGRHEEALLCYNKVIECNPAYAGGYINRSNLLVKIGRKDEALIGYNQAATMKGDAYQAYIGGAEILLEQSRYLEAIEKCQLAIKIKSMEPVPNYLLGVTYFRIRELNQSVAHFKRAIELKPQYADAYNGMGSALVKAGYFTEGQECYVKALEINPEMHIARINLADSFFTMGDLKSALENFQKLRFEFQPLGLMQFFKQQLADWSSYDQDLANFLKQIRVPRFLGMTEDPWHLLRITDSPAIAKDVAQAFVRNAMRGSFMAAPARKSKGAGKIKLGYFSPDFREHAVSHLALELFKSLSRDKFETYAFSFGFCSSSDVMRPKLEKAFDHFIDINSKNDEDVVKLVRELGVDIAFDLAGITAEARMGIFANRAAPIQVNYLGFTSTLGTNFHDYIIADKTVIPDGYREHYTEKVVHLPCVMPFDTSNALNGPKPSRADVGLPEKGFIFCSFNQCFKITPDIFRMWMRIMSKVPDSYLWFSPQRESAMLTFRNEAINSGINPERLIFAPRMKKVEDHLGRLQVADLFLDTFPYNAHTSAMDSLWSGVPMITRSGDSFASRLAASLLNSLGLSELIVTSVEEYEALAVKLATTPEQYEVIKKKTSENRSNSLLFNMKLYRDNYERALIAMYDQYQAGRPPEHIVIS